MFSTKNVTSRVLTRLAFDMDLVDPKWLSFKLDLEIIKINILSKIHDDYLKNVTSRVLTRFSFALVKWPSFWPQVIQFQTA